MKKLFFIAIVGLIIFLLFSSIETVSPHDRTATTVLLTEQRIRLYWEKNGKLPPALTNLPLLPGRENETKDAWRDCL
jgi:hypothetical protein